MTTSPVTTKTFKLAQTFFLDPSVVKNATEVGITKIDLFIKAKPPEQNNKSGIMSPGIEVTLVPVINGIPAIDMMGAVRPTEPTEHGAKFAFYSTGAIARKEWGEIQASNNASIATSFTFQQPYFCKTNLEYAILVTCDGNEDFIFWNSRKGEKLVGTQTPSPGVSGKNIGNYFEYISPIMIMANTTSTSNTVSTNTATINNPSNQVVNINQTQDQKYLQSNWKSVPDLDLKFRVYVARYFYGQNPVATNTTILNNPTISSSYLFNPNSFVITSNGGIITLVAPVENDEYILFDRRLSTTTGMFYGDVVYQEGPYYPGNKIVSGVLRPLTVSVVGRPSNSDANSIVLDTYTTLVANGSYVMANGSTFNSVGGFNNLYTGNQNDFEAIVIVSGNQINVRRVTDIVSNNTIKVSAAFNITNNAAYFFKAPIGFIKSIEKAAINGKNDDLLTLYSSNANGSVRFVNNCIESITVTTAGSGYSNSDYITISGYEDINYSVKGGYPATANIVTNGSGAITAVYVSNQGCGFVNTSWLTGANVVISNSSNLPSTGTSAAFTYNIGSTIKSQFTQGNSYFSNVTVINIEAMRIKPEITVNNPLGTSFAIRHRSLFYREKDTNTYSGYAYYVGTSAQSAATDTTVKIFKGHSIGGFDSNPVIPSRSNQFTMRYQANGGIPAANVIGEVFSNAVCFLFDTGSNSEYQATFFDPDITRSHYAKYIINNDYTGEETNSGNAYAKHVCTKVSFSKDRLAEDLLVYLTAYRPIGTDIKVYAKLHNSKDSEPFDDHQWTLLECIDGGSVYSSRDNSADFIELTYNIPQYPNTSITFGGSVSVSQGNDIVSTNGINLANSTTYFQFNGNSAVDNANDFISISNHTFKDGDTVTYYSLAGNTAISGLANNTMYYIVQSNSTGIKLASSYDGANVNITATASSADAGHYVYKTAVVADDMVKIYSRIFNNTYVICIVNNVINNSSFKIKRGFGDLSANLVGTVTVNTTSTNVVGTGTTFTSDYSNGDYIAVWVNTSFYDVRKVNVVGNNTSMNTDAVFSSANTTGAFYSYLTPDAFSNTSVTGDGLKLDLITFKYQAFNNQLNENVVRYYNSSMVEFDGYDSFQIKLVMISNNDYVVPKIDDVRAIGVSA